MKANFAVTWAACGVLIGATAATATDTLSTDVSQTVVFVKDSAITTKIKTKLAAEHLTSMEHIHVGTDKDGVVWLSGSARSQEAVDKAISIAHDTERVTDVHSDIVLSSAD